MGLRDQLTADERAEYDVLVVIMLGYVAVAARQRLTGIRNLTDWRAAVLTRDRFQCRAEGCGARKNLHAHHVIPRAVMPTLALDIDNGLTLCGDCHAREHPEMAHLLRARRAG